MEWISQTFLLAAFTHTAAQIPKAQKDSQVIRVFLRFWELHMQKLLVKSTPVANFINVKCTAFVLVDPKSVKRQLSHQWLFTLLGSMSVKAVHRTLMKLSPGVRQTYREHRV
jgi:hypothetical protein